MRCINLIYIEDADFVMMTKQLGSKTVKVRKVTNNLGK